MKSPIRPQIYTKFFSIRFRPEDVERLKKIAKEKGYYNDEGLMGKLKRPKIGITRLIREIVERYLNSLDKS